MTTTATSAVSSNPSTTLTLQDFLQVLTTQLTYQDPLKPLDNQQFMAQIAQFTTLEQTQELTTTSQTIAATQSAQQSVGMIGRKVNVTTSSGPQSGTITAVDLSGGTPSFTLTTSGSTLTGITFSQISSVQQ
ncbi:MAG TPA: flagellar hook capping FlgD N-terminal domain-containing protein [Burkholderiaceae bacterium]